MLETKLLSLVDNVNMTTTEGGKKSREIYDLLSTLRVYPQRQYFAFPNKYAQLQAINYFHSQPLAGQYRADILEVEP